MSLFVKLWGVRGSLPTPYNPKDLEKKIHGLMSDFLEAGLTKSSEIEKFFAGLPVYKKMGFGGNTMCAEVSTEKTQIIVDGGSGIRALGQKMMAGPCGLGKGNVHILFTHFHWDHLIGLPFFIPIFIPGNKINVYAVQDDLKKAFLTIFQKPYFPVPYEGLSAEIIFHKLEPRQPDSIGDIKFTPYQLDHPDPCWGYRFENQNKIYSHCVDTECSRISREDLGPDLPLYQDVDVMVFDAQYSLLEATEKINWGHAAATFGLDIGMREGIKKMFFVHHDPAAADLKN